MSELAQFTEKLNRTADTLNLLVEVSEQTLPKIAQDVKNITEGIQNGFNEELLKYQAKKSINEALTESNVMMLNNKVLQSARALEEAVDHSYRRVENLRRNASIWKLVYCGLLCFLLGALSLFGLDYTKVSELQAQIGTLNATLNQRNAFINSTCKLKKEYAASINSTIDCSQYWN